MSNPSNLYAEKIFSEHPLALWALDEQADYVSLITETKRNVEDNWTITNATAITGTDVKNIPFSDSYACTVSANIPVESETEIILKSPDLVSFSDLDKTLGSFSVASYFYSNSVFIRSISIGYEYVDTTSGNTVTKYETFSEPVFNSWSFISGTFKTPDENAQFTVVIKVVVSQGGTTSDDYSFVLNGLSVGQWSEEFHVTSLGITPEDPTQNIAISSIDKVLKANSYGINNKHGYYLINNNSMLAKNTSIPLVFGASGSTKIVENAGGLPSVLIPGQGFLNEHGRYNDYTVEFWARINSDTVTPKRIFGPISSTDGLYVEGGFLTLKINKSFKSHFIGQWYRPMLIDIRLNKSNASVLVNGEEVISFSIDQKSLILPSILSTSNKEQDWLGFYAYNDVTPIELDCVAIYPYTVPATVAKRRFVYGQALVSTEGVNSAYGGSSVYVDYSFADYSVNYNYPDFAQWQQASFDNLNTTSNVLTTPRYSLPQIFTGSKTLQNLYDDCKAIQSGNEKFITFRPNSSWNSVPGYFNFPGFNILSDEVHAIYAVVKLNEVDSSFQTIIEIQNTTNGNKFSIKKHGTHIDYYLTFNGVEEEILMGQTINAGEKIAVGIDIPQLVSSFGGNIAAFFGNRNGLTMYVAGNQSGTETFKGYIYAVGLSTSSNEALIADHFSQSGTAVYSAASNLLAHTASYTLLPTVAYGEFFLDIGISGHWEDYMPLSYFAKYVKNDVGNEFYDLDFLQLNIDYPSPSKLIEKESASTSWTYQNLKDNYANPEQRSYSDLDNFLFTGFVNYEDLSQNAVKYFEYNTEDAEIRSYITFQYLENGANATQDIFVNSKNADQSRIIDIDNYPDWQTTKFEFVDNTIIYPTKSVDFNKIAAVYRLEFNVRNSLTKPISLRKLETASQVLNDNSFNTVKTKFGIDMYPYKRSGFYFDYKSKNPFSIYKESTPYLYMTRNSGIEVRGDFDPDTNRGLYIPVNSPLASNYKLSAMQMWYRYDMDIFPGTPTQLFEINYKNDIIKFYIVATNANGSRAKIFALSDNTGQKANGLSYFWNGNPVREAVVTTKEWGVFGISFAEAIDFGSYAGSIALNGPGVFNNISYYQANSLQQLQAKTNRLWINIKTDGITEYEWSYWLNNYNWNDTLVLASSQLYGINPADIYKTYIGTNKIIVDDQDGITINVNKVKVFDDMDSKTIVVSPV